MLVDVSHVVEHGMVTYKGLPAPLICDFLSREQSKSHYAPGTEFHIGKIEMVANTGTYLDSPFLTARWLRRIDPNPGRGLTCFWCYLFVAMYRTWMAAFWLFMPVVAAVMLIFMMQPRSRWRTWS